MVLTSSIVVLSGSIAVLTSSIVLLTSSIVMLTISIEVLTSSIVLLTSMNIVLTSRIVVLTNPPATSILRGGCGLVPYVSFDFSRWRDSGRVCKLINLPFPREALVQDEPASGHLVDCTRGKQMAPMPPVITGVTRN